MTAKLRPLIWKMDREAGETLAPDTSDDGAQRPSVRPRTASCSEQGYAGLCHRHRIQNTHSEIAQIPSATAGSLPASTSENAPWKSRPRHQPPHQIHKAKGLDAKAVIVLGLPPHQDLTTDYDHFSWFMAVSRTRQLLALVESIAVIPQNFAEA